LGGLLSYGDAGVFVGCGTVIPFSSLYAHVAAHAHSEAKQQEGPTSAYYNYHYRELLLIQPQITVRSIPAPGSRRLCGRWYVNNRVVEGVLLCSDEHGTCEGYASALHVIDLVVSAEEVVAKEPKVGA